MFDLVQQLLRLLTKSLDLVVQGSWVGQGQVWVDGVGTVSGATGNVATSLTPSNSSAVHTWTNLIAS